MGMIGDGLELDLEPTQDATPLEINMQPQNLEVWFRWFSGFQLGHFEDCQPEQQSPGWNLFQQNFPWLDKRQAS